MDKSIILENLLKEIEILKGTENLKSDSGHHISYIIAYYNQLKNNFSDSEEFNKANDAMLSLKEAHPEISNWIDQLLTGNFKKFIPKEKKIRSQNTGSITEFVKAVMSSIKEHHAMTKNGNFDSNECNQYLYLMQSYRYSFGQREKELPQELAKNFKLIINKEIKDTEAVLEYINGLESDFTR